MFVEGSKHPAEATELHRQNGLLMKVACFSCGIQVEAESGVAAQPIGMEETRLGALNRLKAARASAARHDHIRSRILNLAARVDICGGLLSSVVFPCVSCFVLFPPG